MPNDAKGRIDSPVELWKDVSRELWEVQLLGGGTRHMTADELAAAFARQEIHPRTPVRKQGTATWMTLREARRPEPGPHANAIAATSRKAPPLPHPKTTPFQPTIEELAVVRPSSALGKIIAFAAVALVGGGIVAAMTAKATGPRPEDQAATSAANAQTPAEATPRPEAASAAAIASPRDDAGTPPAEGAAPVTPNGAREVSGATIDASAGSEAHVSADAGARAANEAATRASADGGARAANETATRASADGGTRAANEAATRASADGGAKSANEASARASVGAASRTPTRASSDGGARAANEASTRASADASASGAATRASVGAASRTPTRASAGGGARGTAVRATPRAAAHHHASHATAKLEKKKSEPAPSKRAKASAPKKAEPKNARPGPRAARDTTKHAARVCVGAETSAAVV